MDHRVGQLIADMQFAGSLDGDIDVIGYRDEIVFLFSDVADEESRVALIQAFHAVTDLGARAIVRSGRDPAGLESARRSQQTLFCLIEAGGDQPDPVELWRIVSREVAAGRMQADEEFVRMAEAGAQILGPKPSSAIDATPQIATKKGWWGRVFGV